MGLYRVVILFACVPRLPAKGKKRPLVLFSVCLSLCPFVLCGLITDNKKHGLLWVVSLGVVVWCLVSPIERTRTLQAGCRFGLSLLFCRCPFVCLSRWGLQCNINYFYLWPPCGSCNNMSLLCFSCCFLLSF